MLQKFLRNHRKAIMILACAIGLAIIVIAYLLPPQPLLHDEILRRTFENTSTIETYTQEVETTVNLDDRILHIAGIYHLDGKGNQFASHATTTLTVQRGKNTEQSTFTLQNISINNDLYVQIVTADEKLQTTIPHDFKWRHFQRGAIPSQFANIAVSGPVLDNLLLLKENGSYLTLQAAHGKKMWGAESLLHYTFTLSSSAPKDAGGTLGSLLGRIGDDGTVELWIDEQTLQVRHLVFSGKDYHSTTTISAINTPKHITIPVGVDP